MRTPAFSEEIPTDCACAFCTGAAVESARRNGGTPQRCTVRGAIAAAVGAAALVGAGAGTAAAEPAPSHAGWDGSKYWYKDGTGWWRWTSHYDKYKAHAGGSSASSASSGASSSAGRSTAGHSTTPTFRGKAGWDSTDRVYWYKKSGSWWWTSHQDRYERYAGSSSASSSSSSSSSSASSSSAGHSTAGHNSNPTFRGRSGWDSTDRVYWYQSNGSWWWTSHQDRYEARTGKSGGSSSQGSDSSSGSRGGSGSGSTSGHGTEAAISYAMAQLGDPYVWGGNGPDAWDCSGLVQQAYRRAGISVPRVADDQYRASKKISRGELRRGDLVFWSSDGTVSGIHHVAIYLGGSQYLEAPRPGKTVRISSFAYYNPNMYGRVG